MIFLKLKHETRQLRYVKIKDYIEFKRVFLGSLNKNQKDELKIMMERIVDEDTDSIYIFPSTRELLYDTELIGNGFDKELVSNNVISKFI